MKSEVLFDNKSLALGTAYSRVNFVIESQVTIQAINLDPDDVITFEIYYLTSGTMDKACGCFIKPGEMPTISGTATLMCPDCDEEGNHLPVRLTSENPIIVLDSPQGLVIRARYDGPGLGQSTVWVTNGTNTKDLTPEMRGCPTECCEPDDESWEDTGERRCDGDEVEGKFVDNCGNEEWRRVSDEDGWTRTGIQVCLKDWTPSFDGTLLVEYRNACGQTKWEEEVQTWADTGVVRCDGASVEVQKVNDCGDLRWDFSGSTLWTPTGEIRCTTGNRVEQKETNACGDERWTDIGEQTWTDTGQIRCIEGSDAFTEKEQVNDCGQTRWVAAGAQQWNDSCCTECRDNIVWLLQTNQCGRTRWVDTGKTCGYEPGVFLPCGGIAFLPGEGDPDAVVELKDCNGNVIGMVYPSPREGANTPVSSPCPDDGPGILGYAVNGGHRSPHCDPVVVDTYEDCGIIKAVWSDGTITVIDQLEPCCEDECSCEGMTASISTLPQGGYSYDFIGAATPSDNGTTIVSWAWDFGDNTTDTGKNVNHTFLNPGTYAVTLTVEDDAGCKRTTISTVEVKDVHDCAGAIANFSLTRDGLEVTFADESTASAGENVVTWLWDFGDGALSSQQNPVHTYGADGTYLVKLTMTDSAGCTSSITQEVAVQATGCEGISASFQYFAACGLEFVGRAIFPGFPGGSQPSNGESITDYAWVFGDGNKGAGEEVQHTYAQPGTYLVTLKITDSAGCTDTITRQLKVPACCTDEVESEVYVGYQADDLEVEFSGSVSFFPGCYPDSWSWNFGDGNSSSDQNPTHTYEAAGNYIVTLTVADECGCEFIKSIAIHVDGGEPHDCSGVQAVFTKSVSGMTVSVDATNSTASAGETVASYAWQFLDANDNVLGTDTGVTSSYTWSADGTVKVRLTVTDTAGCSHSSLQTFHITDPCADVVASINLVYHPGNLGVTGIAGFVPGASYSWNWGDGSAATTTRTANHTYASAGTYTITLTVTRDGCTSTATKSLTVTGSGGGGGDCCPASFVSLSVTTKTMPWLWYEACIDIGGFSECSTMKARMRFKHDSGSWDSWSSWKFLSTSPLSPGSPHTSNTGCFEIPPAVGLYDYEIEVQPGPGEDSGCAKTFSGTLVTPPGSGSWS